MQRRDFLGVVAGIVVAGPRAVHSQQTDPMRRIGVLMGYADGDREGLAFVGAFREGLQKLGWLEGRNIRIDDRWGSGSAEPTEQFAKELVALKPDAILSHSTVTTAAILKQTRTIPVIFANVSDPIGSGFVTSFSHPGGNATGFVNMQGSIAGKWLELLKEAAPRVRRVALLFNPVTAPYFDYYLNALKAKAPSFVVEAVAMPVHAASELEDVVAAHAREPNGGLIVMTDNFTTAHRVEITSLASQYRLPTIYPYRFFVDLGGLLSYGSDTPDNFRRAAAYVDRLLRGAAPSELPVQAPVKFELIINLKTAKALDLEVSTQLQQLANEVIE